MSDSLAAPVTVNLDPFNNSGEMLDEVYHLQRLFHLVANQEYPPSQDLPCILHLIADEAVKEQRLNYPLQPLDAELFVKAVYYEKKYLPQLEGVIRDYFQLPPPCGYESEDEDPWADHLPPFRGGAPRPTMAQANKQYKDTFFSIRLALLQDFQIFEVLEAYIQDLLHYHNTSIQCYEDSLARVMDLATKVRTKDPKNKNAMRFTAQFEEEHRHDIREYQEHPLLAFFQDETQRECISCIALYQKAHELKTWHQYHGAALRFLSTYIRCLEEELRA